jgi:hypothetical protein
MTTTTSDTLDELLAKALRDVAGWGSIPSYARLASGLYGQIQTDITPLTRVWKYMDLTIVEDPALPPDTIVWLNGKREVIAVTMPEEKGKAKGGTA